MSFQIKFNELIKQFKLSNRKISSDLSIDASLISRWRNGIRLPSLRANQYYEIAKYFYHHTGNIEQTQYLERIINRHKVIAPHIEDPILVLEDWLMSPIASNDNINIPLVAASVHNSFTRFRNVKEETDEGLQFVNNRPIFPLSDLTKRTHHLFFGNVGKRKAVLYLLQTASKLKIPTNLYFFSNEQMQWWIEDEHFQIQWSSYMKQIVLNGHQIHLIHHVLRDTTEFSQYLTIWIPLHLIGSIHSYYYPRYVDFPVKSTIMIIKNVSVIVSSSTIMTPKENLCYLYEDIETVELYESLFLGRLASCEVLIKVFKEEDQEKLLNGLVVPVQDIRPTVKVHNHFNSIFIPFSVFERYCESWDREKKISYLSAVKKWRKQVLDLFEKGRYRDIFPFDIFESILNNKNYAHFDPPFFLENLVYLTKKEIIETTQNMIDSLKKYPLLELVPLLRPEVYKEINLNFAIKENSAVFFTTNYNVVVPYIGLLSTEGNLIRALMDYGEGLLSQIPSSERDRNFVIKKLETFLEQFSSI